MAYIQGKSNDQGTLFPVTFDDLIPDDHLVRVIDAYIKSLDFAKLGFDKATPAQTGRPAYHRAFVQFCRHARLLGAIS